MTTENNANHSERDHAILSPSASKANHKCIGGAYLSQNIEGVDSEYAEEGSEAHEVAEHCAGKKLAIKTPKIKLSDYDDDMILYGKAYAEFIVDEVDNAIELIGESIGKTVTRQNCLIKHFIEGRVKFSDLTWGTPDYYCIIEIPKYNYVAVILCDYKYGRGVMVDADNNEQVKTYCVCIAKEYYQKTKTKIDTFFTSIYQPRVDLDNPSSHHIYDWKEITDWAIERTAVEKKFLSIQSDEEAKTKLNAEGLTHCRFCNYKPWCGEFAKEVENKTLIVLNSAEPLVPDIDKAPTDVLIKMFKAKKAIETCLKDAEHVLLQRGIRGEDIGDLKVVAGQARRKWISDEKQVCAVLKAHGCKRAFRKSLITLGEAEKQIKNGKEVLAEVTFKSEPKNQLTTSDDKRPAISTTKALDLLTTIE